MVDSDSGDPINMDASGGGGDVAKENTAGSVVSIRVDWSDAVSEWVGEVKSNWAASWVEAACGGEIKASMVGTSADQGVA